MENSNFQRGLRQYSFAAANATMHGADNATMHEIIIGEMPGSPAKQASNVTRRPQRLASRAMPQIPLLKLKMLVPWPALKRCTKWPSSHRRANLGA
jgi:hypothetical protein